MESSMQTIWGFIFIWLKEDERNTTWLLLLLHRCNVPAESSPSQIIKQFHFGNTNKNIISLRIHACNPILYPSIYTCVGIHRLLPWKCRKIKEYNFAIKKELTADFFSLVAIPPIWYFPDQIISKDRYDTTLSVYGDRPRVDNSSASSFVDIVRNLIKKLLCWYIKRLLLMLLVCISWKIFSEINQGLFPLFLLTIYVCQWLGKKCEKRKL